MNKLSGSSKGFKIDFIVWKYGILAQLDDVKTSLK